jgi:hypothetical protein
MRSCQKKKKKRKEKRSLADETILYSESDIQILKCLTLSLILFSSTHLVGMTRKMATTNVVENVEKKEPSYTNIN